MKTIVSTKLTEEQTKSLVEKFLVKLGIRLRQKRERINLSQKNLSECLGIDQSVLSKYEYGVRDMNVSLLPLFSTYCGFPLHELFPVDESQLILDTFAKAVTITAQRKQRQAFRCANKRYDGEGIYFEDKTYEYTHLQQKSVREQYREAEIKSESIPYNQMEFCTYAKAQKNMDALLSAGQFLNQIDNLEHKNTLKKSIADYIIDELIINNVAKKGSDESSKRAYAYYRKLYRQEMDYWDEDEI